MLPVLVERILQNFKNGSADASSLKKALNSQNKNVTKAQRLELATRALDHVTSSYSSDNHQVFLSSISLLRDLIPFLKSKSRKAVDTVAGVELYTVNFALLFPANSLSASDAESPAELLTESLCSLFESRNCRAQSSTRSKRSAAPLPPSTPDKENHDPQVSHLTPNINNEEVLDRILYPGASGTGLPGFLPQGDSPTVTSAVAGALSVKLTCMEASMELPSLLYVTKCLIVPWIAHHASFPDKTSQRLSKTSMRRVNRFLLNVCKKTSVNPCLVLRARAFALQLGDVKLNHYARDILQSVNNLVRSRHLSTHDREAMWDAISDVHRDALKFAARFDMTDHRWLSEDVSVWFDNIISVWSRTQPLKPIPQLLCQRLSILRKAQLKKEELRCYQLQIDLYNVGAYCPEVSICKGELGENFDASLWEKVELLLDDLVRSDFVNALDGEQLPYSSQDSCAWHIAEKEGLKLLRLLRVLEPLRRTIVGLPNPDRCLPLGGEMVLRTYLNSVSEGYRALSYAQTPAGSEGENRIREVFTRFQKMVGAATEAAHDLLRHMWYQSQPGPFQSAVSCIFKLLHIYADCSDDSSSRWRDWLVCALASWFEKSLNTYSKDRSNGRTKSLRMIAELARVCEQEVSICYNCSKTPNPGRAGLLLQSREAYVLLGEWKKVAELSLQALFLLGGSENISTAPWSMEVQTAANRAVRDLTQAAQRREHIDLRNFTNNEKSFVLKLLVEYSYWARQNCDLYKSHKMFSRTVWGLREATNDVLEANAGVNDPCPVGRLHREWLSFTCNDVVPEEIVQSETQPENSGAYAHGHFCKENVLNMFNTDIEGAGDCSSWQTFLKLISEAWRACCASNFTLVGQHVKALRAWKGWESNTPPRLDLTVLSVDILAWISTELAIHDKVASSISASELSERCSPVHPYGQKGGKETDYAASISCVFSVAPLFARESEKQEKFEDANDSHCKTLIPRVVATDLVLALESAYGDIKKAVSCLRIRDNRTDDPVVPYFPFQISGTSINIGFSSHSDAGRRSLFLVLSLIRCLWRYSVLLIAAENLREASYYMTQCFHVAQHCLPADNNSVLTICALYQTACRTDPSQADFIVECNSNTLKHCSRDSAEVTDAFRMVSMMLRTAKYFLRRRLDFSIVHGQESLRPGALELLKRCDRILDLFKSRKDVRQQCLVLRLEWRFVMGLYHTENGEFQDGLVDLDHVMRNNCVHNTDAVGEALYHKAKLKLQCVRDANALFAALSKNLPVEAKRTSRVLRSAARRGTDSDEATTISTVCEIRNCLEEADQLAATKTFYPWLSRGLRKLHGFVSHESVSVVAHLSSSLGASFNIRWKYARRKKGRGRARTLVQEEENIDSVNNALQNLSVTCRRDFGIDDVHHVSSLLQDSKCVLVGLNISEDRSKLIVWRLCGRGACVHRVALPDSGPSSFESIVGRIDGALSKMKTNSYKGEKPMTEKAKRKWWEDRYALDKDVESILVDIENDWLSDAKLLLVPSVSPCTEIHHGGKEASNTESLLEFSRRAIQKSSEEAHFDSEESGSRGAHEDSHMGQLVLMLDTELELIPWESLPFLRTANVSATRSPSLEFLKHHLSSGSKAVHKQDLLYVVNPAGDLTRTEERLAGALGNRDGWAGVCGAQGQEVVSSLYSGQDLYLFCGHGSGESYFSPSKLCRDLDAPVSLLMGCSSVRPDHGFNGAVENGGTAIDFLTHGSQAVVGNLWDVSDGEIDRLTSALLSSWLGDGEGAEGEDGGATLSDAVTSARRACRLPYLVGAACVVIGAPNITAHSR